MPYFVIIKERKMKVVLKQDVKGTGKKGDIAEVSDGFARNFLIKKGLAEEATSVSINSVKIKKEAEAFHIQEAKKAAKETAQKISKLTITLKVKCGENGKVFGSVTSKEVAGKLSEMGYDIDKKKIVMPSPIKQAGHYTLEVKLLPEAVGKLKLVVETE